MEITTHFPLSLPNVPLMPHKVRDKIVASALDDQKGKTISLAVGDEKVEATIKNIFAVEGGFDTTIEFEPTEAMLKLFGVATGEGSAFLTPGKTSVAPGKRR
jgi:hypothetical protein